MRDRKVEIPIKACVASGGDGARCDDEASCGWSVRSTKPSDIGSVAHDFGARLAVRFYSMQDAWVTAANKSHSTRTVGRKARVLGRSALTGQYVYKPVSKKASISLNDVSRAVRSLNATRAARKKK
jgi:hypothetical protein